MKKIILLATLLVSTQGLYAQSNYDYDMDMEQSIDVSGTYSSNKKLTPAQKMKLYRKRLEKQNELMVKKKIETLRYKQEVEMMKKLKAVFNQQMKALDNI